MSNCRKKTRESLPFVALFLATSGIVFLAASASNLIPTNLGAGKALTFCKQNAELCNQYTNSFNYTLPNLMKREVYLFDLQISGIATFILSILIYSMQ